jgi:hypothetical protein
MIIVSPAGDRPAEGRQRAWLNSEGELPRPRGVLPRVNSLSRHASVMSMEPGTNSAVTADRPAVSHDANCHHCALRADLSSEHEPGTGFRARPLTMRMRGGRALLPRASSVSTYALLGRITASLVVTLSRLLQIQSDVSHRERRRLSGLPMAPSADSRQHIGITRITRITRVRGVSRGETCSRCRYARFVYVHAVVCASRVAGIPRRALRRFVPGFCCPGGCCRFSLTSRIVRAAAFPCLPMAPTAYSSQAKGAIGRPHLAPLRRLRLGT